MSRAVGPVTRALTALFQGAAPTGGELAGDKVYWRRAKSGSPLPYVILQAPTGAPGGGYVMRAGSRGIQTLSFWHLRVQDALKLYEAWLPAIDGVRLVMAGLTVVEGRLEYVTDAPDLDSQQREVAYQAQAIYRYRVVEAL